MKRQGIEKARLWWRYVRKKLHFLSFIAPKSKQQNNANVSMKPYLLALIQLGVGVLAVLLAIYTCALPAWSEFKSLRQQQRQQNELLNRVEEFALTHEDYEAFTATKFRELAQVRSKLPGFTDVNQVQGRLQQLATRQGLMLKQVQVVESRTEPQPIKKAKLAKNLTLKQLKLELVGDYFALVRWLKQVEKQHIQVQMLEIKGRANGQVLASLSLRCIIMAQSTDIPIE